MLGNTATTTLIVYRYSKIEPFVIPRAQRFFRLDNYYLNYRILEVQDLYKSEVAKFMYGHYNDTIPTCFNIFFKKQMKHIVITREVQTIEITQQLVADLFVGKNRSNTMDLKFETILPCPTGISLNFFSKNSIKN